MTVDKISQLYFDSGEFRKAEDIYEAGIIALKRALAPVEPQPADLKQGVAPRVSLRFLFVSWAVGETQIYCWWWFEQPGSVSPQSMGQKDTQKDIFEGLRNVSGNVLKS